MATLKRSDLVFLSNKLEVDLLRVSPQVIRRQCRHLSAHDRQNLLERCLRLLQRKNVSRAENQDIRLALIRILVASVPESLPLIRTLLTRPANRETGEVHFSLFATLGWEGRPITLSKYLLSDIEEYLFRAAVPTAQAAWMAAELLGAHWPNKSTFPVLFRVARQAPYVSGRDAAVDGLTQAFRLGSCPVSDRRAVRKVLRQVAVSDRSTKVRRKALLAMSYTGPMSQALRRFLTGRARSDPDEDTRYFARMLLEMPRASSLRKPA